MLLGDWPGGDPAVVAIAGLTGHHRALSGIAEALAGELRVVAPDLRGRGCSTPPRNAGIAAHAHDVLALMDALGLECAVLAGHSMGAYVAAEVARQAPGRAIGVAMLDGGTPLAHGDGPGAVRDRIDALQARLRRTFLSVGTYLAAWRAQPGFEAVWNQLLEDSLRYDLRPVAGSYALKADPVACAADLHDVAPAAAIRARLRQVRCPIAAVGAEHGLAEGSPPALGAPGETLLRELGHAVPLAVAPATNHVTLTTSPHGAAACAEAVRRLATGGGRV